MTLRIRKALSHCSVAASLTIGLATPAQAENLLELWEHVIESNPNLKASEHSVEKARAQQDQVLAKLLPNVGIRGNYGFNSYNRDVNGSGFNIYGKGNMQYNGYMGSLQVTQALFDLPSYLQLEGADKQTRAEEQSALSQRMKAAYDLVDNYLIILEATDIINQLEAEYESIQRQLERMRHMHERQLVKVTDLYEVEAYSQAVNTSRIEASNQRSIAIEKLREITGVAAAHPDPLVQEQFPEMARSADDWVQEAHSSNPYLLALQYGAESAQHMIASAEAQHLPTLSASVSETISNTITNNLEVMPYNIGSAYLNIVIPIYAGGGVEAGVKEAVHSYEISREKIELARREIEKDTRTAWFNVNSGQSRIESSRKEADFREKAKIAQQTSYEVGATTIVNVLDAHRRLLKATTDYKKSKYDFIRSLIRLRLNAGSLADLDLEAVSQWFAPEKPPQAHLKAPHSQRGSREDSRPPADAPTPHG